MAVRTRYSFEFRTISLRRTDGFCFVTALSFQKSKMKTPCGDREHATPCKVCFKSSEVIRYDMQPNMLIQASNSFWNRSARISVFWNESFNFAAVAALRRAAASMAGD